MDFAKSIVFTDDSKRERMAFQRRFDGDATLKEKRSVLAFASVGLQAVTSRLPSNEWQEANRKWRRTANENARGRDSKKYSQGARYSHTTCTYTTYLFFLVKYRKRSFPKLEPVLRICLSISCSDQVSHMIRTSARELKISQKTRVLVRFQISWMGSIDVSSKIDNVSRW